MIRLRLRTMTFVLAALVCGACLLGAQDLSKNAPRSGFVFLDQRTIASFEILRWVDAQDREVSPSGMCNCITVIYLAGRKALTIDPGVTMATEIDPRSGQDINHDGMPALIVTQHTGGAHCCISTKVYSVSADLKTVLDVDSGNCTGSFEDLDNDGRLEFATCDDRWAYADCDFASSPMPPVIYAYNENGGVYSPVTPKYRDRFRSEINESIARSEKELADPNRDPNRDPKSDTCAVLGPVLDLMYTGRFDEGLMLFQRLYHGADARTLEEQTIEKVKSSPHWVAAP
jgi:hypothetical protein